MKNNSMNDEVWKDISGYEGLYQISNHGRIYSIKRGIFRKPRESKGYLLISLSKEGAKKSFSVHRIVASEFLENPENKPEVNHLDENPLNNRVDNLMWCTSKENSNWGTRRERISKSITNHFKINGPNTHLRPLSLAQSPTIKVKRLNL